MTVQAFSEEGQKEGVSYRSMSVGSGGSPKRTFTTCVLLPTSVSDGIGGRAPSTIFWYSSARRTLTTDSGIVGCVSRSCDSISGWLSHTAFVIAGLCGIGVTTFVVDADDAALAAPMRASCRIFPARPRSRENHARTLFHDCCAPALLLEGSSDEEELDECGTANTASIFAGRGDVEGQGQVGGGWGESGGGK